MPGSYKLAFLAKKRRVVNGEEHVHGGLVNMDPFQWLGVFKVSDGITDFKILDAHNRTDIPGLNLDHLDLAQPFKYVQFFYSDLFKATVGFAEGHKTAFLQRPSVYPTDSYPADEVGIIQGCNLHLWSPLIDLGRWDVL